MLFLKENQVGFDRHVLGFPSVKGCHAIVLQSGTGLFGLHSFGGSRPEQVGPKAKAFGEFVNGFDITDRTRLRLFGR